MSEELSLRLQSLVLMTINVFQPIPRQDLDKLIDCTDDELSEILSALGNRRLIRRLPRDRFRVTWKGQHALWTPYLRKQRDIHRMWHLFSEVKEGDGSQ